MNTIHTGQVTVIDLRAVNMGSIISRIADGRIDWEYPQEVTAVVLDMFSDISLEQMDRLIQDVELEITLLMTEWRMESTAVGIVERELFVEFMRKLYRTMDGIGG